MKLCHIYAISGQIRLLSGLHIGAGKDTVEIGGLDQPIIKNPLNQQPYIPGSSLKGKMRSLLETSLLRDRPKTREAVTAGMPCHCGERDCPVCVIFGVSGAESGRADLGPTRLLVRDATLCDEDARLFGEGRLPMEIKYENTIDRVKGTAAHPRPLERVPAGVSFKLSLAFKQYENDPADLLDWVFRGLRLVELDALGGCSSRGCGEVRFENIMLDGMPLHANLDQISLDQPGQAR